jgi:hypothetical protein
MNPSRSSIERLFEEQYNSSEELNLRIDVWRLVNTECLNYRK